MPLQPLRALAIAGLVALGTAAAAGEAQDRLFAVGVLGSVETGQELVYGFERLGDFPPDKISAVTQGKARLDMRLDADGKREAIIALNDGKRDETFDPFPADAGNPMFMVFMEQNVRAMATLTGGSPFYIRDRLKDALFRGGVVEQQDGHPVASFQPFATDPNRDRMYGFGDLTLRFVLDGPDRPIRRMLAETGPLAGDRPAYRNEMVLK